MDQVGQQLEQLYRDRFGAFRAMAAAVTGGWDTDFDAVQEGFARAYARRPTYRADGSSEPWGVPTVPPTAATAGASGGSRLS